MYYSLCLHAQCTVTTLSVSLVVSVYHYQCTVISGYADCSMKRERVNSPWPSVMSPQVMSPHCNLAQVKSPHYVMLNYYLLQQLFIAYTWCQVKTATTKTATDQNDHRPKRPQTKTATTISFIGGVRPRLGDT
jgi:hypothetical protein